MSLEYVSPVEGDHFVCLLFDFSLHLSNTSVLLSVCIIVQFSYPVSVNKGVMAFVPVSLKIKIWHGLFTCQSWKTWHGPCASQF